jgi:O-acetyl-ADP-ribose deacetylase (regulator of RNase III)
MAGNVSVIQADITTLDVDAIVNAANSSLLGGGGVDGAIHRAAGAELLRECRALGGCPTGEAKITQGYNLPARWVIHAVGPVWWGGDRGEDAQLASCYRNSLRIAEERGLRSVAFPSISTGAYGFPVDRAAAIACAEVLRFLETARAVEEVTIVCFSAGDHRIYSRALYDAREEAAKER